MDVFIGRQPIFNKNEQVVAFELLYRNGEFNAFPNVDPDLATVDVLINAFLSIGLDELTNGKPCFINFTENLLESDIFHHLDPSQIYIEVLETVEITPRVINRLQLLKKKGFTIVLDDFELIEGVTLYDELFQLVTYIKIDFMNTAIEKRLQIENRVKSKFQNIQLLAEKVETREEFLEAKNAGYSLFQGYFFEQPIIIKGTDIPANMIQYFQVIALLREKDPNINQIAERIERDVSLSFKLLKLINSSSKRTKSKVRSIKQAVILLGLNDLRKWIYVLAYRESKKVGSDEAYMELMRASLFRAKVCELTAKAKHEQFYSEFFLVGMFSLIDTILQRPLNMILQQLPLSDEIAETISGGNTPMQPYLQFSIALEKLDWDNIKEIASELSIKEASIMEIYNAALEWSKSIF